MGLIFLKKIALNKCTIIYMSMYAYKCHAGYVLGLLYSKDTLREHWEERKVIYLDTVVGAVILMPRKEPTGQSGRDVVQDSLQPFMNT